MDGIDRKLATLSDRQRGVYSSVVYESATSATAAQINPSDMEHIVEKAVQSHIEKKVPKRHELETLREHINSLSGRIMSECTIYTTGHLKNFQSTLDDTQTQVEEIDAKMSKFSDFWCLIEESLGFHSRSLKEIRVKLAEMPLKSDLQRL